MKQILLLLLVCLSCSRQEKTLHIFMWSDYITLEAIQEFEETFDCKIVVDTYDSNESMYTKLIFGAEGYDVLFPSTYYLSLMKQRGLLSKLDMSLIPNAKNINWEQLNKWGLEPSSYGVPYLVSFSGLGYRSDRVQAPTSWNIFADEKLRGRMTLLNDPRETLGAALRYLNYSVNTKSAQELAYAAVTLGQWKQNCAKFESEQYKNGIASSEFLVCHGYSSDLLQVSREMPEVQFAYPKEGSVAACDSAVILQTSHDKELAHAFINFLHIGGIAKKNMLKTCAYCPNVEAIALMSSEEIMEGKRLPTSDSVAPEVIRYVPEAQVLYMKTWDEVKSS